RWWVVSQAAHSSATSATSGSRGRGSGRVADVRRADGGSEGTIVASSPVAANAINVPCRRGPPARQNSERFTAPKRSSDLRAAWRDACVHTSHRPHQRIGMLTPSRYWKYEGWIVTAPAPSCCGTPYCL